MSEKLPQLVVCAANRYTIQCFSGPQYLIIVGARHYDEFMRRQIEALDDNIWNSRSNEEQGFIDNRGNFLTREEALRVALLEDQVRRRVGGDDFKLFSENLY